MANRNDPFFSRLTSLFRSGPAIQRKVKGYDYKNYYDNQLARGNNGHRGPFPFGRESSPFSVLGAYGILDRMARYSEFAEMEYQPEIAAALNIFADETSAGDERGKAFHLFSKNPEVKKALEELFYDILNIDFNIRPWVRNLVKYGDFFLYNEVVPDIGIINVQPIPVNELEREDGFDQNDPYAIRYKWLTRGNRYLENWQVTHMRVLGNDLFLPYGTSILEPARRVWRQLCVRSGTPIWIDGVGYKQIEDVLPGDIVQTYDLENNKIIKAPVKGCYSMGKQALVRIKTAHRTIDVTPNHGMLVKTSKGEMIFKEAKDLICSSGKGGQAYRNADKLVLPSGNFETNEKTYTVQMDSRLYSKAGRFSHSCNDSVILSNSNNDRTFTTSPDFMRLFGFMHGDGWAGKNKIGFALGVYEEQNTKYIELFEQVFKGVTLKRTDKSGTLSSQVNVTSAELCHLFRDKLDFKTGFANKRIPSWVYSLDQENKVAFLKGLFDADGSDKDGRISLANKNLLEDTKILAQQAGVTVGEVKADKKAGEYYFNKRNKDIGKKSIRKASCRLYINFNKINRGSVAFEAVNHVETLLDQDETYDLEVNHSSHNFCANGVISHNTMMEDSMLLYRVVRSPERRVFYIDVGNVAPNDVPSYMEAVKETLKSRNQLDKSTGQMDARYNPLDIESDYFIPVRGGTSGTKIETLPGGQNATAVDDVKYLQQKMFAALQVPKPFLNFDENLSAKASLAQQDVRFSRTISVLQRVIISELNKMAMVHLYSKGFDGEDLLAFELRLSNPSTVAMQQKLEAMSTKFDIAGKAKETKLVDEDWIQRKILELTEDDIIKISSGIRRDKIREVEIEAIAVAENLPQKNTVTDPFDPSGYIMPGGDVKKNPPVGGTTMVTDVPTNQTSNIQNAAAAGVAIAGNPGAKAKSPTSGVPISANPFTTRQRHNDRRLVGMGGRDNLQNPDFANMLSATNKHMTDINDKHSLTKLSEKTLGRLDTTDINLDEFRAPPLVTSEVKQLKRSLDAHFEKVGGRKKKIIITENDVNLSKLDEEDDGRLFELTMSGDNIIVEATNKNDDEGLLDDLFNDE